MPKIRPIQRSFTSGEINPVMKSRSDLEAWSEAVEESINMTPTIYGPMSKRAGTKHICTIPSTFGRILEFYVAPFISFAVIVTTDFVYILDHNGEPVGTNLVVNGSFIQGSTSWTLFNLGGASVIFVEGVCSLLPGLIQDAAIGQYVALLDPAKSHNLTINLVNAADVYVNIGIAELGGDYFDDTISGQTTITIELPAGPTSYYIYVGALANGNDVFINSIFLLEETTMGDEIDTLNFASPWSTVEDIAAIQFDMSPEFDQMILVSPNVAPYTLSYGYSTGTFSWSFAATTFTDPPSDWTTDNYPATVCFEQGRLWFAGIQSDPQAFWGSKSLAGTVTDFFTFSAPADPDNPLADESVHFRLNTRGRIVWMKGSDRDLLIGTDRGEYRVTSEGGIIIPGDVNCKQQSFYGSAPIQPLQMGNKLVFVGVDRSKIYLMQYKWVEDGFVATDLSYFASHLTETNKIIDINYAKNPYSLIFINTSTGVMLGCAYDPSTEKLGWTKYESQGTLIDSVSVAFAGQNILWVLSDRGITDNYMHLEMIDSTQYLDNYGEQYNNGTPSDEISFPHLAGKTVKVITDGALHPDITLDSNGDGTLDWKATDVHVGLGYTGYMKLLPVDLEAEDGSYLDALKRYNKIHVGLHDSGLPLINGVRPPTRLPSTEMNEAEGRYTGTTQVSNLGYSKYAQIEIEQDLPIKLVVTHVAGELSQDTVG